MYIKTKQSAVWVDGASDGTRTSRPPRVEGWATRPLHTHEGMARALRFDGTYARVLLEPAGRRRWVPLASVMSDSQAGHWSGQGSGAEAQQLPDAGAHALASGSTWHAD